MPVPERVDLSKLEDQVGVKEATWVQEKSARFAAWVLGAMLLVFLCLVIYVGITGPVAVSNFPASQTVTGSVGALLYGVDSTGTLHVSTIVQGGQFVSASSPTLSIGGRDVGNGNLYPLPVTGSGGYVQITGSVFVINQSAGGAASNVTAISGSVTGLLVGGVAVAGSNPVPVTGSVGITAPITGSVVLASAPTVIQGTSPWVTSLTSTAINSGSVTGLLVGGVALSSGNPVPITGSVGITSAIAVSNFPASQTVTGSVGALLYGVDSTGSLHVATILQGGQFVSGSSPTLSVGGRDIGNGNLYPIPVTGSGGSVNVTGSVVLAAAPVVNQGTNPWVTSLASTVINSGSVTGLLLGGVAVSAANPVPVTSSAAIGTNSGTLPGVSILTSYKDPGGLNQPSTGNSSGASYHAIKSVFGTRNIVGAYRAVVGPLTGTIGPLANIVNPNTGSLTVYVKQIQITSVFAGSPQAASDSPVMIYCGSSNATLTGTTVGSVAMSSSFPATSQAVVTSGGSNNAVTTKLAATYTATQFGSGTAWNGPIVSDLLDHTREPDDYCMAPGKALTIANTGGVQANHFYIVEISWDEGGPA